MQIFDASSMIYGWENYPIGQFPRFWRWIGTQIEEKNLMMPRVAFEEVGKISSDCGIWLRSNNIEILEINNTILQNALRIKGLLGIVNDQYHAKGVGENDIFIIATAYVNRAELVSDEGRQTTYLNVPAKRKIPAVCSMPEVAVPCINFIEYIKRSNEIFG